MPNYDASSTNNSKRASRSFSDLDLDFGRNTVTNDVNKLTNVEAIKRSVRNLINTSHFERPFHPEIGSNVRAMLEYAYGDYDFDNARGAPSEISSLQARLHLKW